MVPKKKLIDNELMKEIAAIRVDTLWKMLGLEKEGLLPESYEEGATGKFDNKGAIFIPGGLIYQDVDEEVITYDTGATSSPQSFRKNVRAAMQYDNATLLFPDGIAGSVNLDSGFFSKAARRTYTYKKAAFRRNPKVGSQRYLLVGADDLIRSHCPPYLSTPYGARTRVSTCVSMGLINPPLFFSYCKNQIHLSGDQVAQFARRFDAAQELQTTSSGSTLYPVCVIVCHDTRYKQNNLVGLTRLLGIGKFGEFATFSLEAIDKTLTGELKRKKQGFTDEDIFASHAGMRVLGILRVYAPTNPGKRSPRYTLHVLSPEKDLGLNLEQIEKEARARYHVNTEA